MAKQLRSILPGLLAASLLIQPAATFAEAPRPPHLTNTDEAKVGTYVLPPVLALASGAPVRTAAAWRVRRAEILRLAEDDQFGRTPSTPIRARVDVWERGAVGLGGLSRRSQIRIRFSDNPDDPVIHVLLHVPAKAVRPPPVVLSLSFEPNVMVDPEPGVEEATGWDLKTRQRVTGSKATPIGHLDVAALVQRGYAVASVYYGDIEPDFDGGAAFGVRRMFPGSGQPRGPHEWGAMGAWAWGASKVLDYLLTDPEIDGQRTALLGASRLGKAALWAGARDERFAMVIPVISGEGGAALSRRDFGETIADLTAPGRYGYWFAPHYADFAADPNTLPLDAHMLLALIAPRPMLLINGSTDTWSDPTGEWLAAQAATPVYTLLGREGLPAVRPSIGQRAGRDLAMITHEGPHGLFPKDVDAIADFMDARFGSSR